MESLTLNKFKGIDNYRKEFIYEVIIEGEKSPYNIRFPFYIVGYDFPKRFSIGETISVSYFGDTYRQTVDWIGTIRK